MSWEPDDDGPSPTLMILALGGSLALLVLSWMHFAGSGDETVSSSGFDSGGPGIAPPPASFAERRAQTGLAFVGHPTDVPSAPAGVEPSPGAAGGGAASSSAAPPAADKTDEPDPRSVAALGVPTDKAGLSRLGSQHGLLSRLTIKALGYPKVVKFLLNNKLVVDGYFARESSKRNCGSASALQSYLANGSDPKGVSEELPIIQAMLKNPASAAEAVNSEFGKRVMACPSVAQVQANPAGMAQVVMANPSLLSLAGDPAAASAVSSNPQASALFNAAQSAVGLGAAR